MGVDNHIDCVNNPFTAFLRNARLPFVVCYLQVQITAERLLVSSSGSERPHFCEAFFLFLFPVLTVSILSAIWVKNRSPGIASAGPYLYERIFGLLLDRIFADMGHNKPLELEMGPKPRTVLQL